MPPGLAVTVAAFRAQLSSRQSAEAREAIAALAEAACRRDFSSEEERAEKLKAACDR